MSVPILATGASPSGQHHTPSTDRADDSFVFRGWSRRAIARGTERSRWPPSIARSLGHGSDHRAGGPGICRPLLPCISRGSYRQRRATLRMRVMALAGPLTRKSENFEA